jgi:hypothetical protein
VRYWEDMMDFINKNRYPNETYILTSRLNFTLEEDDIDEEYM